MEFPNLGERCSESSCKMLDFLPMKCDACHRIFCKDHITYISHHCSEAYTKDNQVPVCPLCNRPVPVRNGESADVVVGAHIDNDCQSDPARDRRAKIYKNRCSLKGCKQKELVPVRCADCGLSFCIRHRHPTDHDCQGRRAVMASAAERRAQSNSRRTGATDKQQSPSGMPDTSGDEALARALAQESRHAPHQARLPAATRAAAAPPTRALTKAEQEASDLALARALQESELEQRARSAAAPPQAQRQNSETRCRVS